MVNWDVNSAKFALNSFYFKADFESNDDQTACQWIAENSDTFFDIIDGIKQKDGTLTGVELQILFKANAELLNDMFKGGIAKKMHPVIEQMGLSTMQHGPLDRNRFKAILNKTFLQFAESWGVKIPPTGVWGMQGVQQAEFNTGGMRPGVNIQSNTGFGMNMSGSLSMNIGGSISFS